MFVHFLNLSYILFENYGLVNRNKMTALEEDLKVWKKI